MAKVKTHADFLSMMVRHGKNPGERKKLIHLASKGEVDACCEIYLNVLKGNAPITPFLAKKLRRHKENCRLLIDRKQSLAKKKKILTSQTGGFLPLLIGALAPLLGPVIKGVSSIFGGK